MPGGATLKDAGSNAGEPLARIDQYELVRELGGGGFGTVYLAKDTGSDVLVAVKGLPPVVKSDSDELENIKSNFGLVHELYHPNIAAALVLHPVSSVVYHDEAVHKKLRVEKDDLLMVMAYAPGITLSRWRKQFPDRKVPIEKAIAVVRQIASALDYAHGQRIIHRDIKPANVMVETRPDGKLVVRVLDFGLAAEIRSSMSRVSREIHDTSGTRPYMAPEQWLGGRQGAATDQYSLAVLFHELVTGDVPFASVFATGDPMVMLNAVGHNPVDLPDDLPGCVKAALIKALSKSPGDRFDTCAGFVDALEGKAAVEPPKGAERAAKSDAATSPPLHSKSLKIVAAAVLLVALVGAASWLLVPQTALRKEAPSSQEPARRPSLPTHPATPPLPDPPSRSSQPADPPQPSVSKVDEALRSEAFIMKGKAGQARDRNAREEWHSWPYFETRAKDVESLYRAGVEAFDKGDYKLAKEIFGKIRENMQWLDVNKKSRVGAAAVRQRALSAKKEAESLEASRFANPEWESASADLSAAERQFDEGRFGQSEPGFAKAEDLFRKAGKSARSARESSERKNATAKFIAAYDEKRYVDAARLRHDIDVDDQTVQFDLGWMYYNGYGLSQDYDEAIKWWRKAANAGNAHAQANIGVMYASGRGVRKDEVEAVRWYRMAAEQGHSGAQKNLGICFEKGQGVAKDEDKALHWYNRAMAGGCEEAKPLAEALQGKHRRAEDTRLAIQAFTNKEWADGFRLSQSADRDDPVVQFYLGVCYDNGYGVDKDSREAVRWYRKAADNGSLSAQFNLGVMYSRGDGIEKDEAESEKWYRKAADGGYEKAKEMVENIDRLRAVQKELADLRDRQRKNTDNALMAFRSERWHEGFQYAKNADKDNQEIQYYIGVCHSSGFGGAAHDDREAAKWFKKAADQGHVAAQARLGRMYFEGTGVSVDYNEGFRLARKAAESGSAQGLALLGIAFYKGLGVQQSYGQMVKYMKQAEQAGDADAIQFLAQFRNQLSVVGGQLLNEYMGLKVVLQQPFLDWHDVHQTSEDLERRLNDYVKILDELLPYCDDQRQSRQTLQEVRTMLNDVRQIKETANTMLQIERSASKYA